MAPMALAHRSNMVHSSIARVVLVSEGRPPHSPTGGYKRGADHDESVKDGTGTLIGHRLNGPGQSTKHDARRSRRRRLLAVSPPLVNDRCGPSSRRVT